MKGGVDGGPPNRAHGFTDDCTASPTTVAQVLMNLMLDAKQYGGDGADKAGGRKGAPQASMMCEGVEFTTDHIKPHQTPSHPIKPQASMMCEGVEFPTDHIKPHQTPSNPRQA